MSRAAPPCLFGSTVRMPGCFGTWVESGREGSSPGDRSRPAWQERYVNLGAASNLATCGHFLEGRLYGSRLCDVENASFGTLAVPSVVGARAVVVAVGQWRLAAWWPVRVGHTLPPAAPMEGALVDTF